MAANICPVCSERTAEIGVLCEECRDELATPIRISPEQIQLRVQRPTPAALVDLWGRPHPLDPRTLVGRQIDSHGLAVLEPSVSRHHAHLTLDGETWTIRDLGSANGTFVDDRLVEAPIEVHDGSRIRFGHIGFYLVEDIGELPPPRIARTQTNTLRPASIPVGASAALPPTAAATAAPVAMPPPPDDEFAEEERTNVGLPEMRFALHEPTGGGGGLVEIDGKQVQLTTTQFELMALMIKRMASERHQPELVRGFVRSSELIADLSWDTREPSENHVKQLVRRVRRALMKSEIGDLIESRHRFGYRLRAIPKD
ncbi:MAG TPA: FHA domain-containing protein [Kofleriaceae bacterium]|nr:FHA domain-containing protein [Kofleriaceae bacterium]